MRRQRPFAPKLVALEDRLTPVVELVSVNFSGTAAGNGASGDPATVQAMPGVSADGRFVAFDSGASNLTDPASNGNGSALWRDTLTGVTKHASRGAVLGLGRGANISADGRFVAYSVDNFVYVYDSTTDTSQYIDGDSDVNGKGTAFGSLVSPDGRYVAYRYFPRVFPFVGHGQIRLFDTTTGGIAVVYDPGATVDGGSYRFTGDSKTLVFESRLPADRFVPGFADANDTSDIFAYDLAAKTFRVVTTNAAGTATPSTNDGSSLLGVSNDGSKVLFFSFSADIDPTAPQDPSGNVFVRDAAKAAPVMVSASPDRKESEGTKASLSANGRYVVFESAEPLLGGPVQVNVFRRDLVTDTLEQVNVTPDGKFGGEARLSSSKVQFTFPNAVSADGRFVTFVSPATDLVAGVTNPGPINQLYVRDMDAGVTVLLTPANGTSATGANAEAYAPTISADGKVVYFNSVATNLVSQPDTNKAVDLFRAVPTFPPPNAAPTISDVADLTATAGQAAAAVSFTVGDAETAADRLTVRAASSNPDLLPVAAVILGGGGANRTVQVMPVAGQSGTAVVTLTVTDAGGKTATDTFTVTVPAAPPPPPNTAPTISDVPNQTAAGTIAFTVGDAETPAAGLVVSVSSDNPALLPAAGLVLGGNGANRTLTVTPAAGQSGTGRVTLTVTDAGGRTATDTFDLTVPAPPVSRPALVGFRQFAVGSDRGGGEVRFFNPDGSPRLASPLVPFPGFTGGVRTAAADFNGDGVADIIAGTGPGRATRVVVLDGVTQKELFGVDPFEAAFVGGVYVTAGDVNGDGRPDLVVTPDEGGGPRVDIYSGAGFGKFASFFAFQDDPNFRGGARAAVADVNGDGSADVVVSAGFGGGPRIATFDGRAVGGSNPARLFGDFFAFEPALRNGAFVAAGDLDADGKADLIFGGGPGGGPRVTAFSAVNLIASNTQTVLANFFAGNTANRGGIRVAVKDLDGSDRAALVTGSGTGGGTRVTGYRFPGASDGPPEVAFEFDAPAAADGVFVG